MLSNFFFLKKVIYLEPLMHALSSCEGLVESNCSLIQNPLHIWQLCVAWLIGGTNTCTEIFSSDNSPKTKKNLKLSSEYYSEQNWSFIPGN